MVHVNLLVTSRVGCLRQGYRLRKAMLPNFRPFSVTSAPAEEDFPSSSLAPLRSQQHQTLLSVAIVGRPNVGKSTLFNRLTKSKQAIVTEVPGTTRDRKEAKGQLAELEFNVIDTGGLDDRGAISVDIQKHVNIAVQRCHLILFLIDGKEGITALDSHFATWLRKCKSKLMKEDERNRDIVCVVNKAEGATSDSSIVLNTVAEALELGFGDPLLISAAHGDGMSDLASLFLDTCDKRGLSSSRQLKSKSTKEVSLNKNDNKATPIEDRVIQLSIMGRPNVGKSTLLNSMIGEERVIVGPTAGLTRDAIQVEWQHENRIFKLVDTAGLTRTRVKKENLRADRKNAEASNKIGYEKIVLPGIRAINKDDKIMYPDEDPSQFSHQISEFAQQSALNSLKYAQVVLLVVEGEQGQFSKIDLQLARKILQEGRAIVIAANKADILARKMGISPEEYREGVKEHCNKYLREFGEVPVFVCSALENKGVDVVLDAVKVTHDAWSTRINTWILNTWLKDLMISFPPPRVNDKQLKVKYVTQLKARPPSFAFFCNGNKFPGYYERFLRSKIQEDFNLQGIPLRFVVRKSEGKEVKKDLLRQGAKSNRTKGHNLGKGVGIIRRQKGGLGTYLKRKRFEKKRKIRKKDNKFAKRTGKLSHRKKNYGAPK